MRGCTKWRCGDAPDEMWRTGDAQGASCVNFLPNSQAVFLIVLVLYLLCTCISHWQKIYKHSQQILFISITSLNLLSSRTQRSSLKCVQDMWPGPVQDLKVLSHFLCSHRLPFITLTAVRQRVGTVSLENYLYLPFSGFSILSSQGSSFFLPSISHLYFLLSRCAFLAIFAFLIGRWPVGRIPRSRDVQKWKNVAVECPEPLVYLHNALLCFIFIIIIISSSSHAMLHHPRL